MFSGLSDYLKKILPKRLFYRALLIVAIPVLVLQLLITIVFFDSLWIKTNKGMTRTLVNEISTFIEAYGSEQENKQELLDLFSIFLELMRFSLQSLMILLLDKTKSVSNFSSSFNFSSCITWPKPSS